MNFYCRRVLPGKMVDMLAAMQSYAAYMRENVPGVMAITAGVDAKDPSLVHDLQVLDCIWETLNSVESGRIYENLSEALTNRYSLTSTSSPATST